MAGSAGNEDLCLPEHLLSMDPQDPSLPSTEILSALASPWLLCDSEDEVLDWVCRRVLSPPRGADPREPVSCLTLVRFSWISPSMWSAVWETLNAPAAGGTRAPGSAAGRRAFDDVVASLDAADRKRVLDSVLDAADERERRTRAAGAVGSHVSTPDLGAFLVCAEPGSHGLGGHEAPRESCLFTCGVDGAARTSSLGVFAVWLDPRRPLGCNDARAAASHGSLASWAGQCPPGPLVLNGAQCLAAVRAASAHPALRGLGPAYCRLAAMGRWVRMVDLARLAALWLCGGVYVDADLSEGTSPLPAPLLATAAGPLAPALLVLPGDDEGMAHNCFMACPARAHPVVGAVLLAAAASAETERSVLEATGPVLLSGVLAAVQHLPLPREALPRALQPPLTALPGAAGPEAGSPVGRNGPVRLGPPAWWRRSDAAPRAAATRPADPAGPGPLAAAAKRSLLDAREAMEAAVGSALSPGDALVLGSAGTSPGGSAGSTFGSLVFVCGSAAFLPTPWQAAGARVYGGVGSRPGSAAGGSGGGGPRGVLGTHHWAHSWAATGDGGAEDTAEARRDADAMQPPARPRPVGPWAVPPAGSAAVSAAVPLAAASVTASAAAMFPGLGEAAAAILGGLAGGAGAASGYATAPGASPYGGAGGGSGLAGPYGGVRGAGGGISPYGGVGGGISPYGGALSGPASAPPGLIAAVRDALGRGTGKAGTPGGGGAGMGWREALASAAAAPDAAAVAVSPAADGGTGLTDMAAAAAVREWLSLLLGGPAAASAASAAGAGGGPLPELPPSVLAAVLSGSGESLGLLGSSGRGLASVVAMRAADAGWGEGAAAALMAAIEAAGDAAAAAPDAEAAALAVKVAAESLGLSPEEATARLEAALASRSEKDVEAVRKFAAAVARAAEAEELAAAMLTSSADTRRRIAAMVARLQTRLASE